MSINFDANGKHASPAIHGADGAHGTDLLAPTVSQRDGAPGTDAGPAHDGEAGGIMKVTLVSAKRKDGVLVAKVTAQAESPSSSRQIHSRSDLYVVPVNDLTTIDWSAQGGNGSRGGNGGCGGAGGQGRRGQNANEKEPGHDGDGGGSGGNGGRGTSGGNGGAGGHVELVLKERDTFLLMAVAGCDPTSGVGDRIAGGRGGPPGRHGTGGPGGVGGEGGDLYRYQVKNVTTTTTSQHSKSGGVIQTVDCQYVTMNGGRQGPRGADGSTPTEALVAGQHGPPGDFAIRVTGDNDSEQVFAQRYHVTLDSVDERKLSSMPPRDGIPTLEFGETVMIPSVTVRNTGLMPTPYQRVAIAIDKALSDNLVISSKCRLHLKAKACVKPGETGEASQGSLRYVTWKPNPNELGDDYGPMQRLASRRLNAHQLGPEQVLDHRLTPMSRFSVEYRAFDTPSGQPLRLAYPVENRTGIVGLRILGSGESTSVRFSIRNTSTTALGVDSGRAIHVQYYLNDDEGSISVGLDAVKFMKGPVGSSVKKRKVLSLDPKRETEPGRKGHVVKVKNLPAGAERELIHTLMFSSKAKPFARASLQVDVLLEDLPTLLPNLETKKSGSFTIVQRRKLVVVCQPTFRKDPAAEVILVTSSSTKASQYQAWVTVLETMLGLKTETYSLCIHGHLDPSKDVMYRVKSGLKPAKLRDVFAGRMVIVLNDKFAPLPDESRHLKCRPSLLMARLQDYHPSTRILLVGSDAASTHHLSSLGSSIVIPNGILASERTEPSPSGATERTADPTETDASVDSSPTVKHANSASDTKLPMIAEPIPPNPQVPVDKDAENDAATPVVEATTLGTTSSAKTEPPVGAEETAESVPGADHRQQSVPSVNKVALNAHLGKMKSAPGGSVAENDLDDSSKKEGKHSSDSVQHENIKSFKSWVLRALDEERKSGVCTDLQPGLNIASVKSKFVSTPKLSQVESELSKHASSLRRWLNKEDPVRVYVIEINPAPRPVKVKDGVVAVWGFGTLIIHRGVARDDKSIVEVSVPETSPSLQSPGMIQTMSVLYAVAAAMDTSHKIQCFCHTFRGKQTTTDLAIESVRQVLRDSLVSDFLLDVSYLHDAKVDLDPSESETCTPTLQCLMTDAHIRELMGEASNNSDLHGLMEVELSDLIARLEVSVDPRGDRQWWVPLTFKKSPISLRLSQSVQRLKGAWTLYMNDRIIAERHRDLEDSLLHLLKEDSSQSWREALYHLHSPADAQRYKSPAPISVRRHSQMVTGTTEPQSDTQRSHSGGKNGSGDGTDSVAAALPKCVRYTVDASEVASFGKEYAERKRFSERVRRSLHETRSSFILS